MRDELSQEGCERVGRQFTFALNCCLVLMPSCLVKPLSSILVTSVQLLVFLPASKVLFL